MEKLLNPFEVIDSRLESIEEALQQILSREETSNEKKFYTVEEAAEKLKVSSITIYRNCKNGKIPSKKIGSRLLILGSYVDGR